MPAAGAAGQGERGEDRDERGAKRRREDDTASVGCDDRSGTPKSFAPRSARRTGIRTSITATMVAVGICAIVVITGVAIGISIIGIVTGTCRASSSAVATR